MTKTVLVTGAGGQLGRELLCSVPEGWNCVGVTRSDLDIGDAGAVADCLQQHRPALVVNAAAYTAVDAAESDEEAAYRSNARGAQHLAQACTAHAARLIHISTDFVFAGDASSPYTPEAAPAPLGVYGASKLAGETAVAEYNPGATIIRTGWVYSAFGGNFVKTMLRLMAERDALSVVADQIGTPTWAAGLAQAVWAAAQRAEVSGIYHWSDAGVCSWYDFAVAICEEACATGLLARPCTIRPIPGAEYPTPASRPAFSVLDKARSWQDFEMSGEHWRVQLRAMLQQYKENT